MPTATSSSFHSRMGFQGRSSLSGWMEQYSAANGIVYLDYHSGMVDQHLGLDQALSQDGVHPNEAGYQLMAPLAQRAIANALVGR